jgi:hypothetical protein
MNAISAYLAHYLPAFADDRVVCGVNTEHPGGLRHIWKLRIGTVGPKSTVGSFSLGTARRGTTPVTGRSLE